VEPFACDRVDSSHLYTTNTNFIEILCKIIG
jgi:hypothetical protein